MARRDHAGLFSGRYASYAEALTAVPATRLAGWDNSDSASLWVDKIDPVVLSTYPLFFWLRQLLTDSSKVIDIGGSIGLTYYGYRRFASMPAGVRWTVVEVPAIAQQGTQIAQRRGESQLHFVSSPAQSGAGDVLIAAGALQYMEHGVPGLLESLPGKPRYVLLNKVPLVAYADCWTLQNYGPAVCPYHLFNDERFLQYFTDRGYQLRDRWSVEDLSCLIPFHPELFVRRFSGLLWILNQPEHAGVPLL